MADDYDLKAALGAPESEEPSASKKKGGGYLDGKAPELVSYLMAAVDSESSDEERAEALCRAIEMSGAPAPMPPAEEGLEEDMLGDF